MVEERPCSGILVYSSNNKIDHVPFNIRSLLLATVRRQLETWKRSPSVPAVARAKVARDGEIYEDFTISALRRRAPSKMCGLIRRVKDFRYRSEQSARPVRRTLIVQHSITKIIVPIETLGSCAMTCQKLRGTDGKDYDRVDLSYFISG